MSSTTTGTFATPDDHAARERATGLRHELVDGELFAMTGGTPRHAKVKTNLVASLDRALGDGPCQVYDADLRLRFRDDILYPAASVHCGKLSLHPEDSNATTSPVLVAEVLSPSTEAWDRGGKFGRYRQIASVHHILFIDPEGESIEHYQRDDGRWILRALAGQAVLPLESIGVELALEDVFRNLPERSGTHGRAGPAREP